MDIQNVTQFVNFVEANGLTPLDSSFLQMVQCLNSYSAACNCYKAEDKMKIYKTCAGVYENSVKNVVPKLRPQFLAKTSERQIAFYNDNGQLIGLVSR